LNAANVAIAALRGRLLSSISPSSSFIIVSTQTFLWEVITLTVSSEFFLELFLSVDVADFLLPLLYQVGYFPPLPFPGPFDVFALDLGCQEFPTAIEKPSARRFEKPRISTIEGDSDAATTPAINAKVVTASSVAP
jgi:hypothetical protein